MIQGSTVANDSGSCNRSTLSHIARSRPLGATTDTSRFTYCKRFRFLSPQQSGATWQYITSKNRCHFAYHNPTLSNSKYTSAIVYSCNLLTSVQPSAPHTTTFNMSNTHTPSKQRTPGSLHDSTSPMLKGVNEASRMYKVYTTKTDVVMIFFEWPHSLQHCI